jgi:hypothetical protein
MGPIPANGSPVTIRSPLLPPARIPGPRTAAVGGLRCANRFRQCDQHFTGR